MLKQDQPKSKDAIKDMHDGLQALNTIVEASESAGDRVKNYCDDKYKDLQDKLLYLEVYQQRENLCFYGIEEKSGGKEDIHPFFRISLCECCRFSQKRSRKLNFDECTEWEKETKTASRE